MDAIASKIGTPIGKHWTRVVAGLPSFSLCAAAAACSPIAVSTTSTDFFTSSLFAPPCPRCLPHHAPVWFNFAGSEIDSFRDNPDIDQLEPLFVRYQNKMEAALEDFAADEGLTSETEIIDALRACRDDGDAAKNEWKKLDKMIDTMTKKEEFFIMMMKKAERMHNQTQEPPHPERLKGGGAGGKSNDNGGGSKSSKKWSPKKGFTCDDSILQ